ncbi:hypothetical protein HanPI659440_Chr09g0358241 [Helianthus annuus]|nr:hypothetical protein HanPI659440_Chr09g0358241 [Helianthus annuus]
MKKAKSSLEAVHQLSPSLVPLNVTLPNAIKYQKFNLLDTQNLTLLISEPMPISNKETLEPTG